MNRRRLQQQLDSNCRSGIADPALQDCFEPVIDSCRKMLSALVAQEVELQTEEFRRYQFRILGDA